MLIEELPAETHPPSDITERTMMFRSPTEISAEPLLSDELEGAAAPAAAPVAEGVEATPGGSVMDDPAREEVQLASAEAVATSETTPGQVARPGRNTAHDSEFVQAIVQKTVTKMSPRAWSPDQIEELARKLTGEIIAELIVESY